MKYFDVFNGDADGICSLHQLRLHEPKPESTLITGVKRDIKLLEQIEGEKNSVITVLDISLASNRQALLQLIENNNKVVYIDHHFSGEIPRSPLLTTHISADSNTCTSLIVNNLLKNKFSAWAIAGAFGDNLDEVARNLASSCKLTNQETEQLKEIGHLLNYNAYGITVKDLLIHPGRLYQQLKQYQSPFDFYHNAEVLKKLKQGYQSDTEQVRDYKPILENSSCRIFQLPSEPWAIRVSGTFANTIAREKPDKAHAIMIDNGDKSIRVSVRAPLANKKGADILCRKFPTGGGRSGGAGINSLPAPQKEEFIKSFQEFFA